MYCPVCSQQQVSDETRFCSRCGFSMTGISQVVANNGVLPQVPANADPHAISQRKKGIKRGAVLFFASFVIVPLIAIITIANEGDPPVVVAAFFLTFVAGLLRMLYAFLFESNAPSAASESVLPEALKKVLPSKRRAKSLPPQQSIPVSSYVPPTAGNWRETNDLAVQPPSVTDPTTKLLENDR